METATSACAGFDDSFLALRSRFRHSFRRDHTIDLCRVKSRIVGERPWYVLVDVNHVALDAVMAFAFGKNFDHSMTRLTITAI